MKQLFTLLFLLALSAMPLIISMETSNPRTSEKMEQVRTRIHNHIYSLGVEGDTARAIVDFAMDLSYDAWKRGRNFGMHKASLRNDSSSYALAATPA